MYYGNSSAAAGSSGDNTFLFFDDFSGSSLNTNKWTMNAINTITHTVNNYFRFEDATKSGSTYWIYDNTDAGSQHQAKWTPESSFIVECDSILSDLMASEMGESGVALVGSDNLINAYIAHGDYLGIGSIHPSVCYIFVETNVVPLLTVSSGDQRKFRIVRIWNLGKDPRKSRDVQTVII